MKTLIIYKFKNISLFKLFLRLFYNTRYRFSWITLFDFNLFGNQFVVIWNREMVLFLKLKKTFHLMMILNWSNLNRNKARARPWIIITLISSTTYDRFPGSACEMWHWSLAIRLAASKIIKSDSLEKNQRKAFLKIKL